MRRVFIWEDEEEEARSSYRDWVFPLLGTTRRVCVCGLMLVRVVWLGGQLKVNSL